MRACCSCLHATLIKFNISDLIIYFFLSTQKAVLIIENKNINKKRKVSKVLTFLFEFQMQGIIVDIFLRHFIYTVFVYKHNV